MYSTTRMFITSLVTGILFFGCMMLLSAFGYQMPVAVAANAPVWQPAEPPASATNAIVTTPVELDIAIIGSNPSLQVGGVASYTVYITDHPAAPMPLGCHDRHAVPRHSTGADVDPISTTYDYGE